MPLEKKQPPPLLQPSEKTDDYRKAAWFAVIAVVFAFFGWMLEHVALNNPNIPCNFVCFQ